MVDFKDIIDSHDRIRHLIHRTPILTNESFNNLIDANLFFKCENFQKTGAFKIRGASNAVALLTKNELDRGIATASSGNHGAALAKAVTSRNGKITVIMPEDSSLKKIENVQRNGGEIIWCEPFQKSREKVLNDFVASSNAVVIHPYNDEKIISGQGTAAKEFLEDCPDLDVIISPLSGGGLLSGTLCAAKRIKPDILVFGAEPEEADDACRSLAAGERLSNKTTNTICDGLRAQIGIINFPIIKQMVNGIITLSESEIISSMKMIFERMKIVVEPSSSIVLAAAIKRKEEFRGKKVGLILSGGNVDCDNFPWIN